MQGNFQKFEMVNNPYHKICLNFARMCILIMKNGVVLTSQSITARNLS